MALERRDIEKRDFPIGRRGYDPEAVDAHLSSIAQEVDELKRSGGGSGASLATSAGEQVRAIVEAAESTAAQIRADAERDAKRIVADARQELNARSRGRGLACAAGAAATSTSRTAASERRTG